ncbi:MAG: NADH:flavin oxidoreductase [Deltaproteobacteria bacterium]|nr:NADH:flavin oxidoreductase [Deltaproteobacteria bacterium]
MTHALLQPLPLRCGVTLKNRLALAPLTNGQSHDDGLLGDDEGTWLLRRARGGFGMITTCAAFVSFDGKGFDGQLGVSSDAHERALGPLARSISDTGACGIVQLVHGGARAPSRLTGAQPVAPSAFVDDTKDFEQPRALSLDEIARVADAFVDASLRCARAGFGGVELHAAHGYLLSQFLSRTFNPRTDGWGGDLEGRARLLRELVRRVRDRAPPSFVIGVRLSPEDRGFAKGLDVDETVQVAKDVADDGADFVHVSLWDASKNTTKHAALHPVPLFRQAIRDDVVLIAAGGVHTRADAEALQQRGADVVAVGRAAIVDPEWIARVVVEGREPIRAPRTAAELAAVDVGPAFVRYLQRFPGFVAQAG